MEPEVLECGCEKHVFDNGKVVWIYCDDHEEETIQEIRTSNKTFKMLFRRE
jgi:hypothetical protein